MQYSVLACAIDKASYKEFVGEDELKSTDPYIISFTVLVERFASFLYQTGQEGIIIAEKRHSKLDYKLEFYWQQIQKFGTLNISASVISGHIKCLELIGKKENFAPIW